MLQKNEKLWTKRDSAAAATVVSLLLDLMQASPCKLLCPGFISQLSIVLEQQLLYLRVRVGLSPQCPTPFFFIFLNERGIGVTTGALKKCICKNAYAGFVCNLIVLYFKSQLTFVGWVRVTWVWAVRSIRLLHRAGLSCGVTDVGRDLLRSTSPTPLLGQVLFSLGTRHYAFNSVLQQKTSIAASRKSLRKNCKRNKQKTKQV